MDGLGGDAGTAWQVFARLVRALQTATRSPCESVSGRAAIVLLVCQWGLAGTHDDEVAAGKFVARAARHADTLLRRVHSSDGRDTVGAGARGPSFASLFPAPGDLERRARRVPARTAVCEWPRVKRAAWAAVRAGFAALQDEGQGQGQGHGQGQGQGPSTVHVVAATSLSLASSTPVAARDIVAWAGQLALAFCYCTASTRPRGTSTTTVPSCRKMHTAAARQSIVARQRIYCAFARLEKTWSARPKQARRTVSRTVRRAPQRRPGIE
jgi:hypothetical protein